MEKKEIIYIGDPMCSWCYGFADTIREIRQNFGERAKIRLVMGGLRPDGTHVVDDRYRNFLRGHWQEISQRTGQPFDLSILNATGWIYDTEKPCRAVVVVRQLRPDLEWDYFASAQKGFYFHNHNPNDPQSFARLAVGFGIGEREFLDAYHDEKIIAATQADFKYARNLGVNSFPTVVVKDKRGLSALTVGYQPYENLVETLEYWLEN